MSAFDDFMISQAVKQGNEMQQLREALTEARRRAEQLEKWLNDASREVGNCDLDSVALAIREALSEARAQGKPKFVRHECRCGHAEVSHIAGHDCRFCECKAYTEKPPDVPTGVAQK